MCFVGLLWPFYGHHSGHFVLSSHLLMLVVISTKVVVIRSIKSRHYDQDLVYHNILCVFLVGHEGVVNLLLDAGADVDAVNTVKKTAAEMASFVGLLLWPLSF